MIKIMKESTTNALVVEAKSKLTNEDYVEIWIPALMEHIENRGKINCLLFMDESFEGWEMKAMWQDAKFGFTHRNDFAKLALVGGPKWVQWATDVAKHMMNVEVKKYNLDQFEEALKWIDAE